MKNNNLKILAIETSCDETAAAVIANSTHEITNGSTKLRNYEWKNPVILSNVVSSQVDLHAKTGGVVPEVASRAHVESILPVIEEALDQTIKSQISKVKSQNYGMNHYDKSGKLKANSPKGAPQSWGYKLEPDLLSEVSHIAVTVGPGLIGSLLVGFNTAKALAYALNVPIVPINHIEGHIYSAFTQNRITNNQEPITKNLQANPPAGGLKPNSFPILALTVSGGHTSLTLMHDHGVYKTIGATLDDAAGEAFDKVAKLLDLGYPGGPAVSKVAADFRKNGKRSGLELPLPLAKDSSYNFSFSGLKTSVLYALRKAEKELQNNPHKLSTFKQELACVFEETAVSHLVDKTLKAIKQHEIKTVLLAGGVSANSYLRENLANELAKTDIDLLLPPMELTGDNAAMIGLAAYYHILRGDVLQWNEIEVDSNLKI